VIEEARERQRRQRFAWASSAVLVAGALAIGLALAAGSTGGKHSQSSPSRPERTPAATRTRRASCVPVFGSVVRAAPPRSLTSILAVLRRPATAADKLPRDISLSGDAFLGYVRRTRVVGVTSYYLYPALQGCSPGHVGLNDLETPLDLGHGLMGGTGGGGADAAAIQDGHDVSTGPPGSPTSATITMIVPDGVASVTLRYPAGRASGYSPKISPPFTVTTAPVQNEVVIRVPRSAGGGPIWQPTMVWQAPDGRVIRTFHTL